MILISSIGILVTLLIAPLNDIDSIEDATNKADELSDVLVMVCEEVKVTATLRVLDGAVVGISVGVELGWLDDGCEDGPELGEADGAEDGNDEG